MFAHPLLGAVPLQARRHVARRKARVGGPRQRAKSLEPGGPPIHAQEQRAGAANLMRKPRG
eukprot:4653950-Pyramimonas_sp.AAC.1